MALCKYNDSSFIVGTQDDSFPLVAHNLDKSLSIERILHRVMDNVVTEIAIFGEHMVMGTICGAAKVLDRGNSNSFHLFTTWSLLTNIFWPWRNMRASTCAKENNGVQEQT